MFEMDHVAIPCPDIARGVNYYVETFGAQVLYQDETWAFLRLGQGKLALVTPAQHPPHLALRVDAQTLEKAAQRPQNPSICTATALRAFTSQTRTAMSWN